MIDKLPQGRIILISSECVFPIFYRTRFTTRRPGTATQPHSQTATGLSQLNPYRFAWPFLWQVGHESAWRSYAHGSRKRWVPIIILQIFRMQESILTFNEWSPDNVGKFIVSLFHFPLVCAALLAFVGSV